MASFCRQCTLAIFGPEHLAENGCDLEGLAPKGHPPLKEGEGWPALCEGCGPTLVGDDGSCMSDGDCLEGHGQISLKGEGVGEEL